MDADCRVLDMHAIQDVQHGQQEQIAELMDRYGNQLMNYLLAILRNREDAEDVFQDTWGKVMQRLEDFDTAKAFAPWLFRIARNRAYDHLRHEVRWWNFARRRHRSQICEMDVARSVPFAGNLERRELVDRLLIDLKPVDRDVLWLRFVDELSHEEIGQVWHLPATTVRTRLRRALRRVAERYRELEGKS